MAFGLCIRNNGYDFNVYVYIIIIMYEHLFCTFSLLEEKKRKNIILLFCKKNFFFEFVFVCKYKRTDASQHFCQKIFYKNKFDDANTAMSIMTSILLCIIIFIIFLSLMTGKPFLLCCNSNVKINFVYTIHRRLLFFY